MPLLRAALVAAFSLLPLVAAAPAQAAPDGACTDPAGVTVVVDATALGGDVTVGCADGSPATGTEALQQAGFTDTRDASGLICAIDALPDPCPTTFAGEYWSLLARRGRHLAGLRGGLGHRRPAPGGVEGWRWSDGSAGPEVDLADADDADRRRVGPGAPSTATPAAIAGGRAVGHRDPGTRRAGRGADLGRPVGALVRRSSSG